MRERTLAVLGCAVGAAAALFASTRAWTVVVQARPAPLSAERVARTGAALHPWLPALCLVALAGAGALLATKGRARRAVGALLAACGLGIAAGGGGGWALLCLLGGAVVAAAGTLAAVRGGAWPGMGTRYERSPNLWDAIDRGDDPTA